MDVERVQNEANYLEYMQKRTQVQGFLGANPDNLIQKPSWVYSSKCRIWSSCAIRKVVRSVTSNLGATWPYI